MLLKAQKIHTGKIWSEVIPDNVYLIGVIEPLDVLRHDCDLHSKGLEWEGGSICLGASAETDCRESLLSTIMRDLCCLDESPMKFRRRIA